MVQGAGYREEVGYQNPETALMNGGTKKISSGNQGLQRNQKNSEDGVIFTEQSSPEIRVSVKHSDEEAARNASSPNGLNKPQRPQYLNGDIALSN